MTNSRTNPRHRATVRHAFDCIYSNNSGPEIVPDSEETIENELMLPGQIVRALESRETIISLTGQNEF